MFDEHHAAIRSTIRRVRVVSVDDSGSHQRLELAGLKNERFKNVVRLHDFGSASHPPKDAEGLALALGGRSDRVWALGFEHREHRVKDLPVGGKAIYDDKGNVIRLLGDDGVKFSFDKNKWEVKAKGVTVTSDGEHISVDPGSSHRVYLGGKSSSGSYAAVMTQSGPSTNVFAKI